MARPYAKIALISLLVGILDCVLTIRWWQAGVDESNPVMRAFLELGVEYFLVTKTALHLMSAALLFLVPRRNSLADCLLAGSFLVYVYAFCQHTLGLVVIG